MKAVKAWADVSSHGRIFLFAAGPVYERYGPLMHIWPFKLSDNLVEVEIRIKAPVKKSHRKLRSKSEAERAKPKQ